MNSVLVFVFWAIIVAIGYFVYSKYIDTKVWQADRNRATPAKMYMDGVDFMPANKNILYGFQLNSIAGAAPIIGPIIAIQWGWLPAVLWLGLGVLFIGWVQDYSSCMLSVRSDGDTFGALSYKLISPRARVILLTFVYFYLLLIAAAFGNVIAGLLSKKAALPFPMLVIVVVSLFVGQMIYRWKVNIIVTTLVAIVAIFVGIGLGKYIPIPGSFFWMLIALLIFGYFSSVLPVWRFIQPFNYSSVYVVYGGIILGVLGLLIAHKPITLPAYTNFSIGMGPLWPLLFVTIACGAISGWHSLVSSTGTSRQIENELDVRPVAGGAMFAEFTIAIIAVVICATAFSNASQYIASVKTGGQAAGLFMTGLASAMGTFAIPTSYATAYAGSMILILALTVVNLVFRFMKVATAELLGERITVAKNPHVATIVAAILAFILVMTGTFKYVWVLFGGSNQLMAALALLLVTLFLISKGNKYKFAFIPMLFMYVTTVAALFYTSVIKLLIPAFSGAVVGAKLAGNLIAGGIGIVLLVCALILGYDGLKAFAKYRAEQVSGKPAEA
jgi:carbon starvation protein